MWRRIRVGLRMPRTCHSCTATNAGVRRDAECLTPARALGLMVPARNALCNPPTGQVRAVHAHVLRGVRARDRAGPRRWPFHAQDRLRELPYCHHRYRHRRKARQPSYHARTRPNTPGHARTRPDARASAGGWGWSSDGAGRGDGRGKPAGGHAPVHDQGPGRGRAGLPQQAGPGPLRSQDQAGRQAVVFAE